MQGFTIIEPRIDSDGIDLNLGTPINHFNQMSGWNQVISLENGNFLLLGFIVSQGPYAMEYDPEIKSFVGRFGDYQKPDFQTQKFSDYYGCETSEPDLNGMPADQINDRNQLICRNIKDIRLAASTSSGGCNVSINGRYKEWFLSGCYDNVDYSWLKKIDTAWNSETFESTGILSCYPHTKPTGARRISASCGMKKYHAAFRNLIFTISNNGRLFTRYNLDDQSEVHIDITDLGIVAGDDFDVFQDLVMLDVTESSDGDRIWLEVNFEDNTAYERGVIEDGGLRVVKFVQ